MAVSTISLSIEPTGKPAFVHGFHLGTDEKLARQIAEEMFAGRNSRGEWTCTVALIRDRKILAIYESSATFGGGG